MEIIIWLLIIYFIFGGSFKKKKTPQQRPARPQRRAEAGRTQPEAKPVRPDVKVYTSLGELVRDMAKDVKTVLGEGEPAPQPAAAPRRQRRREAPKPQPQPAEECDYCTGEVVPASVFTAHASAAAPKAVDDAAPTRTVEAACRELGLNPLQQAVVWKEVLDKPVSLRD